jgi:hypothetical protein
MLIAFFNIDELVHHQYVPKGQTVNKEFYKPALQRFAQTSPAEVASRQLDPAP